MWYNFRFDYYKVLIVLITQDSTIQGLNSYEKVK